MSADKRKTEVLTPDRVGRAADLLRAGGLVGIPTETVYGLGANGLDPDAVSRIFIAKGRPQDNPLILHIPEASWLERCCAAVPERARALAAAFWPGPMTMILPRGKDVPDVVTAGLDTVGVRCPGHPLCRELIALAGVPVAAPSGNLSGRPSPTTAADMLEDMDGRIDAILDGGACGVGVESTIIDLTVTPPRLLRPGGITAEQLQSVLGEVEIDPAVFRPMRAGEKPKAPGMAYRHYAPRAPVTVVAGAPEKSAEYIARHARPEDGVICFDEYRPLFSQINVTAIGRAADKEEQARRLFAALRAFDRTDVTAIWAQCPDRGDIGLAVVNRLDKAAGFHVIEV